MLYVLGAMVVAQAIIICAFSVKYTRDIVDAYKSGMESKPMPKITQKKKVKVPKQSEEAKRMQTLLANIDRYDGSSDGQKDF